MFRPGAEASVRCTSVPCGFRLDADASTRCMTAPCAYGFWPDGGTSVRCTSASYDFRPEADASTRYISMRCTPANRTPTPGHVCALATPRHVYALARLRAGTPTSWPPTRRTLAPCHRCGTGRREAACRGCRPSVELVEPASASCCRRGFRWTPLLSPCRPDGHRCLCRLRVHSVSRIPRRNQVACPALRPTSHAHVPRSTPYALRPTPTPHVRRAKPYAPPPTAPYPARWTASDSRAAASSTDSACSLPG